MKLFRTILCIAFSASAALAPEYQRIREIDAIVNNGEVMDALGNGEPFDKVEYIARDRYRVTAGNCSVEVRIADDPDRDREVAGARQFVMFVGEAKCS